MATINDTYEWREENSLLLLLEALVIGRDGE